MPCAGVLILIFLRSQGSEYDISRHDISDGTKTLADRGSRNLAGLMDLLSSAYMGIVDWLQTVVFSCSSTLPRLGRDGLANVSSRLTLPVGFFFV
jgi:hypothetical protein